MLVKDFPMRVWYVDTDQMGIVHHSNYARYYEAARSDLMRSFGVSYAEMESRGIIMPVLEVHSKYLESAHFDEMITVRVILREIPRARISFDFEIYNEEQHLLNTGNVILGFLHSESRRPTRAPEWFVDLITANSDLSR